MSRKPGKSRNRLADVILDEATIPRGAPDVDHERAVAIFDLIEENSFGVPGRDDGPYALKISQEESKLTFDVRTAKGETAAAIVVSMTPFRPLLKDYFLDLRDLLFSHPRLRARARSRRSTASAPSSTTRAPSSWPSASPERSRSTRGRRGACSRSFRPCAGGCDAEGRASRPPAHERRHRHVARPDVSASYMS